MIDKRIGLKGDYPPLVSISGAELVPASDSVNLSGEYYARLDSPHHPDTGAMVAELNAILAAPVKTSKPKPEITKVNDVTEDV